MKALLVVGCVIAGILAIGCMAIWWAYVVAILWNWFVVPLGLQAISTAHAYGLTLVVSAVMSTRGLNLDGSKDKESNFQPIVFAILAPAMLLLFGWITLGFM